MPDNPTAYRPRCKDICCKAMIVFGEAFEQDPDYQAGMTNYWCLRTSTAQGPDGDDVSMDLCSNPERECYRQY